MKINIPNDFLKEERLKEMKKSLDEMHFSIPAR